MASLVLLLEDRPRQIFPLARTRVSVGRNFDSLVRPPCESVSRNHATIIFDGTDYILEDHESLNGTFVNDAPVRRHVLQQHDIVRFGSCTFMFDLHGAVKGPASTEVLVPPRRAGVVKEIPITHTMRVMPVRPVRMVLSPGGLLSKPDQDAPPLTIR